MSQPNLLRLRDIEVENLFNLYNHSVTHNLDARVTILHGPNGVGKTVVLRMINALLAGDFDFFRELPFTRFSLGFDNGARITLADPNVDADEEPRTLAFRLQSSSDDVDVSLSVTWRQDESSHPPQAVLFSGDTNYFSADWVRRRDVAPLAGREVRDRLDFYGRPPRFRPRRGRSTKSRSGRAASPEQAAISEFQQRTVAHLIEAQRLLRVSADPGPRHPAGSRPSSTVATVLDYAADLRHRIEEAMAQYGKNSQALDKSFPARVISAPDISDPELLRESMGRLAKKRATLEALGILDDRPADPFDVSQLGDLADADLRVMTLYVQDTEAKLAVLDDMSRRVGILTANVNRKFRNKTLRLSHEHGFVTKTDQDEILPLDALSSGEQHEVVLLYDLLFRVRANTVVLIDEPELSLHVAWQKQFLPELLEIVEAADFDAIIATHSPFIVGDRADLMVGLGDEEDVG